MQFYFAFVIVLLQHGADPSIRNTDGKTAGDLAEPTAKLVLTGIHIIIILFGTFFDKWKNGKID